MSIPKRITQVQSVIADDSLQTETSNFIPILASIYLMSVCLEGLLRFIFAQVGLANLFYARDLILVAVIATYFLSIVKRNESILTPTTVSIYVILLHSCIAILNGYYLFTVLFGIKIFLTFIFGLCLAELILNKERFFLKAIFIMWILSATGILLAYFFGTMPWEGFSYDTAFGNFETSVTWWAGESRRISGFARVSYNAAMMLGVSGAILLCVCNNLLLRIVIGSVTLFCITQTTTKGMLLAFSIIFFWKIILYNNNLTYPLGKMAITALCILTIFLPIIVVGYDMPSLSSDSLPSAFNSIYVRFTDMWPLSFYDFDSPYDFIFGLGIGSIGTPQIFEESPTASWGDNFFVYHFVLFGAAIIIYIILCLTRVFLDPNTRAIYGHWRLAVLIILFSYGLTGNMIEEPFFSTFLGLAVAGGIKLKPIFTNDSKKYYTDVKGTSAKLF